MHFQEIIVHFLNKPEHRLGSEENPSETNFIKLRTVSSQAHSSNWFNYLAGTEAVKSLRVTNLKH